MIGNTDGKIRWFDLEKEKPDAATDGEKGGVNAVAISGDGKVAVIAGSDTMSAWSLPAVKLMQRWKAPGVTSIAVSPDGKHAVYGSADKTASIVEFSQGNSKTIHRLSGHTLAVMAVAFSPDGKYVVTAGLDMTIRLYDGMNGQPVGMPITAKSAIYALAADPKGRFAAAGQSDGGVQLVPLPVAEKPPEPTEKSTTAE